MDKATLDWRGRFSDDEVQRVHDHSFGVTSPAQGKPWRRMLERHSLGWVTARRADKHLIGFLNVVTDGGIHAWLQDVVVNPDQQGVGIGKAMVELAATRSRDAGCEWLHVDFAQDVAPFYFDACGFRATSAGLRYLQ